VKVGSAYIVFQVNIATVGAQVILIVVGVLVDQRAVGVQKRRKIFGTQVIPNPVRVQVNPKVAGVPAQVLVQALLIEKIFIWRLTLFHILIRARIRNTNLFLNSLF
jgi:hypothetical protein